MGLFKKKDKEVAEKYDLAMNKTRKGIFSNIKSTLLSSKKIDEELFEDLEELFISADLGVKTAVKFIEELKKEVKKSKISSPKDLNDLIIKKLRDMYRKGSYTTNTLKVTANLDVYLFVGVNGVGKTTTIAKLTNKLIKEGKKVCVAAGDTFRAGAVEQIKVWGEKVGFEVISKEPGSDPSSVIFEGIKHAKENSYDVLICDTAGRLQNKENLMKELEKINKVIKREVKEGPQETLLVLDATTGQNGLVQAKEFAKVTNISGIVLTKLDGTAKGGIVLAIRDELSIPIKLVGLGEKVDDLEPFDIESYLNSLFKEFF